MRYFSVVLILIFSPLTFSFGQNATDVQIITTIFESRKGGFGIVRGQEKLRMLGMPDKPRKVTVKLAGREYPVKLKWLNQRALKNYIYRATRKRYDIPLDVYQPDRLKKEKINRVAFITLKGVPTGKHEITITTEDYPVIRRRLNLQKNPRHNRFVVVCPMKGYGIIKGKIRYKRRDGFIGSNKIYLTGPVNNLPLLVTQRDKEENFWFLNIPPSDEYYIRKSVREGEPLGEAFKVMPGHVTSVEVRKDTSIYQVSSSTTQNVWLP